MVAASGSGATFPIKIAIDNPEELKEQLRAITKEVLTEDELRGIIREALVDAIRAEIPQLSVRGGIRALVEALQKL